jgi:hypothetical protein
MSALGYPHLNKSAIDQKLRCDKEAVSTVKARTIDLNRFVESCNLTFRVLLTFQDVDGASHGPVWQDIAVPLVADPANKPGSEEWDQAKQAFKDTGLLKRM